MMCDDMRSKLDPYIDSELSAAELAEFESHLRSCASCAAAALGRLKMKHMTRAAAACYSPTPEFRLRMQQSVREGGKPPWRFVSLPPRSGSLPRWAFPRWAMAAAAAVLLIASAAIWTNRVERERAYTELADLHVATLASANQVDVVSTDRHTVKPWFAGRIPFSFDLPELANSEFTLIGGRVAYLQRNPGAQLLFGFRKHKISVFIFQETAAGFPYALGEPASAKLAFQTESWSEGGLRYYIISDAGAADIHSLGELLKSAARRNGS